MAYETGSTTGNADLVAKLAVFAQANGWSYGTCSGGHFSLSKNGVFVSVAYDSSNIYLMGNTGYSSGSTWNTQPGNSGFTSTTNFMSGTHKAYHFFAGDTYIYAVVEVSTNIFRHFNFGLLTKYGTYDGGQFVNGTRWGISSAFSDWQGGAANYPYHQYHIAPFDDRGINVYSKNHVRADINGFTNKYWDINAANQSSNARSVVRASLGLLDGLGPRGVNMFNLRTILLPIYVDVIRSAGLYSCIGQAPDCRYVNMFLYNPGQLITIGSDEWMIFPLCQKTSTWDNNTSTVQSSAYMGLAYKKVV